MGLNVLIVDDSAVMRAMIARTLRVAGIDLGEVHQAANGREGLQAVEEHWVDLVFADINMPEMNGEEMIAAIRTREELKALPIVVVSTEGSRTRIDRLEQMGTKFVHKPFSPELIREIVEQITGVAHDAAT